jgi:hypothetical protein
MANRDANWKGPDEQTSSKEDQDRDMVRGRADSMEDAATETEEFEDLEDLDEEEEEGEGSF